MKIKINYSAILEVPEIEGDAEATEALRKSSIEDMKKEFCKDADNISFDDCPEVKLESNFDVVIDQ